MFVLCVLVLCILNSVEAHSIKHIVSNLPSPNVFRKFDTCAAETELLLGFVVARGGTRGLIGVPTCNS